MSEFASEGERIYKLWYAYARNRDAGGLLSLYAAEATLESPVARAVMGNSSGVLHGHAQILAFFQALAKLPPNELVRWYREPGRFLFDGTLLMWEYPRKTPDGDQIDILEVMQLAGGFIQHQRVYWGWFGLQYVCESMMRAHHDSRKADV
jgi:hypothetical protein